MIGRIEERVACTAVGITATVPSSFAPDAADAAAVIAALWEMVTAALGTPGVTDDFEYIGITGPADDLVPPHRITYSASVTEHSAGPLPTTFDAFIIDGGRYAVFSFLGTVGEVDDFYRSAYDEGLRDLGCTTRDGQHLERMLPSEHPALLNLEAWIPIH